MLPPFFCFCCFFLAGISYIFPQTDGAKTGAQTGNGNMTSVPSWRKPYFIDGTLPAASAPTRTRGEKAQISVRPRAPARALVCVLLGRIISRAGRANLGGGEEGRESSPMLRRCVTGTAARKGWLFQLSLKTNASFAFTPCDLIASLLRSFLFQIKSYFMDL